MFKRKTSAQSTPGARDIGLLGHDTRFEGTVRFTGTLRIDGTVMGNIVSQPGTGSVLVINKHASVTGDIVSDSVLISGHVHGEVRAKERVEIFRSGYLKGDVYTSDVMIEAGAAFEGYCHMDGEGGTGRAVPSRRPQPAGGKAPAEGAGDGGQNVPGATASEGEPGAQEESDAPPRRAQGSH